MEKLKKIYFIAGVGIMAFGIAAGAVWTFHRPEEKAPESATESGVLGESKEKTAGADSDSADSPAPDLLENPASAQAGKESIKPSAPVSAPPPAQAPAPPPAGGPKPKPIVKKIDPCIQAAGDLEAKKSAAQKLLEKEQGEIEKEFQDLARKRTDAINKYLTAIALATAKYNSSTSTEAYVIYKDEQTEAQSDYAQANADISVQETAVTESKKISRQKYDAIAAEQLSC
ncbi:MAG: hypothetical protein A2751_03490 [Candidatus Doudnabacteria bacterium RIFCSPHIGHO2_01_FULL_46_14]|uniref:Uncharacterized protein n=1 Tax=Candidatus Doudnabacteria bacterium RIFCSPHIGHO2_01_FULL_46_14 TaxID=1817824 RepID=A0A1F5NKY7_9BACT|nr:MAG: hypothetical protein A2751_03490 [Candidatus Doudnabacteria bacterium RIFCSPHIGHO2_01_FULL_46_14]